MSAIKVPLARPSITQAEIDAVAEVLKSGWLAHGEYNHKFEEAFAKLIGVPHAITMNSCTSALEIALKVAGVKGDVIVPSFTWVATANVVVNVGARPVFCEVDEGTRNVTAQTLSAALTPNTEAVIIVHYGGQACQMDDILTFCEEHGLLLIEDSAETLGATWRGRQTGSFGIGCFSFFPTKNITTGEGGMLTCQDDEFARKARALIAHGISSTTLAREKAERPWLRAAEMAGHNYRMPNPLAALGYHQLQRLDEMNARRIRLAARYDEMLADLPVETPVVADGATHVYQMYTILTDPDIRDELLRYMRSENIGASAHFDPPVHLQPFYAGLGWNEGDLPITERLSRRIITLPMYPDMTHQEQDRVVEVLRAGLERLL